MEQLLPVGTAVVLTADETQDDVDAYGRLLRYIAKAPNDAGLWQIKRGNARIYVYNDVPFVKVDKYRLAQRKAKQAKLGLWGAC